jgi:four helix bundle protein
MEKSHDQFIFEGLDAYRVAMGALEIVLAHKAKLKGLPGEIASQLERAAVATVANICEATGRAGTSDRKNRYAIARGEANEAGGMVEIAWLYRVFSDEDYRKLRSNLLRVTQMLTVLIR